MREFQIECGEHKGTIEARSLGAAWRKLTKGKTTGFSPLARFVEDGVWKYVVPQWLDQEK